MIKNYHGDIFYQSYLKNITKKITKNEGKKCEKKHFYWYQLHLNFGLASLGTVSLLVKHNFWSKLQILVKTQNVSQESQLSEHVLIIEVLAEIEILAKNRNFGRKSNFRSKIKNRSLFEILVNNLNFSRKSKIN